MENLLVFAVVCVVVGVVALKSYAESCLPWAHPLNLFLNGDPRDTRQGGDTGYPGDSGIGDSCGGD